MATWGPDFTSVLSVGDWGVTVIVSMNLLVVIAGGATVFATASLAGKFSDLKTVQLLNKKTNPRTGNNCLTIGFL
jgi:hypothetical protein